MKLAQLIFIGMLVHLATTNPLFNKTLDKIRSLFDNKKDPHLWEKSGKFEGDMNLTPEHQAALLSPITPRNGHIDLIRRWPNKRIPYEFSPTISIRNRNKITRVVNDAFRTSCLKVVPRTNEIDYVLVINNEIGRCYSDVGRAGGQQLLSLGYGCVEDPTIAHEFLHAAGFHHQHSAMERDDYVTINWEHVEGGKTNVNFQKYPTENFSVPYDYGSVMHYSSTPFWNEKVVIVPKENVVIGKATKPSESDILKLNRMYDCPIEN